jgi:cytochrome c oxidase assembly protein subunit 11
MMISRPDPAVVAKRNRRVGLAAAGFVTFMVGVSFAAVPLYTMFCQLTGYGGQPMLGTAAPGALPEARTITIRFNANTHPSLPWHFAPQQGSMQLRLGEEGMAFYEARNLTGQTVGGISTYNVTPEIVGRYFHKTACFCFEEQVLEPHQQVDMPIAFWVDPKIMDDPQARDVRTITINYTFFRSLNDAERSGALANAGEHVGGNQRLQR